MKKIPNYTEISITIKSLLKEFYLTVFLSTGHLFMKQHILQRNRITISHILVSPGQNKMNCTLLFFSSDLYFFLNNLLIPSAQSACFSLFRFPLALWASELIRLIPSCKTTENLHHLSVNRNYMYKCVITKHSWCTTSFWISCSYSHSHLGIVFFSLSQQIYPS